MGDTELSDRIETVRNGPGTKSVVDFIPGVGLIRVEREHLRILGKEMDQKEVDYRLFLGMYHAALSYIPALGVTYQGTRYLIQNHAPDIDRTITAFFDTLL